MKKSVLATMVAAGIMGLMSPAWAHHTGHESRTVAQCQLLPGTEKVGERAQCLECVQRPEKHHYHPDYPAGNRCRPDDGKP